MSDTTSPPSPEARQLARLRELLRLAHVHIDEERGVVTHRGAVLYRERRAKKKTGG